MSVGVVYVSLVASWLQLREMWLDCNPNGADGAGTIQGKGAINYLVLKGILSLQNSSLIYRIFFGNSVVLVMRTPVEESVRM